MSGRPAGHNRHARVKRRAHCRCRAYRHVSRGSVMATTTLPLDPTELARVEGMHRGNLYQHLYTVGCIILASGSGVEGLQIDFDEDLELHLKASIYYVQVKTRAQPITPSQV